MCTSSSRSPTALATGRAEEMITSTEPIRHMGRHRPVHDGCVLIPAVSMTGLDSLAPRVPSPPPKPRTDSYAANPPPPPQNPRDQRRTWIITFSLAAEAARSEEIEEPRSLAPSGNVSLPYKCRPGALVLGASRPQTWDRRARHEASPGA